MNRKQHLRMIANVLTLAFRCDTAVEATQLDKTLQQMLRTYYEYHHPSNSHPLKKNQPYADFWEAKRNFVDCFFTSAQPERYHQLENLVELFFPLDTLTTHYRIAQKDCALAMHRYYYDLLVKIANEFITLRDGVVSIRLVESKEPSFFPEYSGLNKVELWNVLSRLITPDVLIAAYFVSVGITDIKYLAFTPNTIFLHDILLTGVLKKGVAETHLHINSASDALTIWTINTNFLKSNASNNSKKQKFSPQRTKLELAGKLRLLLAAYLQEKSSYANFYEYSKLLQYEDEKAIIQYAQNLNEITLAQLFDIFKHVEATKTHRYASVNLKKLPDDLLLALPYRNMVSYNISGETILLFSSFCYFEEKPHDLLFREILLFYLRFKNTLLNVGIEPTSLEGLTWFRKFFSQASQAARFQAPDLMENAYLNVFQTQTKCPNLKKLEMRITPPPFNNKTTRIGVLKEEDKIKYRKRVAKQLNAVFQSYLTFYDNIEQIFTSRDDYAVLASEAKNYHQEQLYAQIEQETHISFPTIGIVYHFIKQDLRHADRERCWVTSETARAQKSEINWIRELSKTFLEILTEFRHTIPYLGEYIVGIDCASEELCSEPWIYAPIYHFARNRNNTLPLHKDWQTVIPNLGLTYHVGEDYHHILSGLRHIDELLTYFGYKPGDRLGHALALQINAFKWIENHEIVTIPIIEKLENLLWMWHISCVNTEQLGCYSAGFEKEIMAVAAEIYGSINGITVHLLWEVYTKKFEDNPQLFEKSLDLLKCNLNTHQQDIVNDICPSIKFCYYYQQKTTSAAPSIDETWTAEKLLLTHYCPVYVEKYYQPVFYRTTIADHTYIDIMQIYLRNKVARRGIYVESNPTSNITIGDISGFADYPTSNINSPNSDHKLDSSVLLSINSDNPYVFNTHIENEFAMVYHILISQGYSYQEVLHWINRAREHGLASSFIRKIKPPNIQKNELQIIVQALKKI